MSNYGKVEADAGRMAARNQRSDMCRISGVHAWHVIYRGKMNYPCGGGPSSVHVKGRENT